MARVCVVTDSTADLSPELVRSLDIQVIPLSVRFGQEEYRDRVTLSEDAFFARLRAQPQVFPVTDPPTADDFEELYRRLARTTDSIVSIHLSGRLGDTYRHAVQAKERPAVRDICRVVVIDTHLTSLALGFVVMEAARAAQAGANLDEIARLTRGMTAQTHLLFFVETLEYLQRGGRIGKIQALVDSVINVKPILRLDDGEITLMEKVRTRAKAIERLFEFVVDFPHVERLGIVYGTTPNEANNLARRLQDVVPADHLTLARYGPVLATHVGPGALGVVVYEGPER